MSNPSRAGRHVCDPEVCGITYDEGCPCWDQPSRPTLAELEEQKRRDRLRRLLADVFPERADGVPAAPSAAEVARLVAQEIARQVGPAVAREIAPTLQLLARHGKGVNHAKRS